MNAENKDDLTVIQKEMLEIIIKAGRRLMHDFDHMLQEIPQSNKHKDLYEQRAKMFRTIFYPDDGHKNYRNSLHARIDSLEYRLEKARKQLIDNGLDPEDDLPF